ncbi:MAG TPA: proton-conducting transporter membrane subunit [Rectinemataceae bacterium]|nr:proton-conducting transporter membrane subunit [Rectinemataceae bacterium]
MSNMVMVLAAIAVSAASGLPSLLSRSRAGQVASALVLGAGALVGVAGLIPVFGPSSPISLVAEWGLPWGGFSVGLDALGGIFLLPVFIIPTLAAIYGLGYRDVRDHPEGGRGFDVFYGLFVAGMALVVVARDATLFLLAWEAMALSSWFVASAESDKAEVRRAGWVYLVATHIGTLLLFAMFSLWKASTGSFALVSAVAMAPGTAGMIFVLALAGFGLKAGLVPLHMWLPGAHANAPSNVSAVMSGVMIKLGVYGILRMTSLMPRPELWWGWTLLALGCLTGFAGIAWATGQADIKRVLAYSSVENIGIVAMGGGLALLGRSLGRPTLILLGMGGALFHVWNHGLFKSLLFMDAGLVIHETGTRRLESLGGLLKRMPVAAALFAVGAIAISALPPLNGFAGEWLIYLGFFRGVSAGTGPGLPAAAAGAAVLASIGALAVAAFVRVFGTVFLGSPRSPSPSKKGNASRRSAEWLMTAPMLLLVLACIVVGLAPGLVLPAIGAAAAEWGGLRNEGLTLVGLADFSWTLPLALALLVLASGIYGLFVLSARRGRKTARPTWDCGYAEPTPRMQYGASSFSEFLGRSLSFVAVRIRKSEPPEGAFPATGSFSSKAPDPVLDLAIRPLASLARRLMPGMRFLQKGQTQLYLAYILVATVILLALGAATS